MFPFESLVEKFRSPCWDLPGIRFKDHKTSIRAGAGVFHDPIQVRNYHPAYIFAGPFPDRRLHCAFLRPSLQLPDAVSWESPCPSSTIGEALEYDPRVTPFVLQYNFGVQREIFKNTVFSLSYVGSRGYYLMVQNDLNPEIPTIVNGEPTFPLGFAARKPQSWWHRLQ